MMMNYETREVKLENLYIILLDELEKEKKNFKTLQSTAVKVGSIRDKYNYVSYDLVAFKLMVCVIRLSKLNDEFENIIKKLGIPF